MYVFIWYVNFYVVPWPVVQITTHVDTTSSSVRAGRAFRSHGGVMVTTIAGIDQTSSIAVLVREREREREREFQITWLFLPSFFFLCVHLCLNTEIKYFLCCVWLARHTNDETTRYHCGSMRSARCIPLSQWPWLHCRSIALRWRIRLSGQFRRRPLLPWVVQQLNNNTQCARDCFTWA